MRRAFFTIVATLLPALLLIWASDAFSAGKTTKAGDDPPFWGAPLSAAAAKLPASDTLKAQGKKIFMSACAFCHGKLGKGDGPGARYLVTKPRNFVSANFKIRSTPSGSLPLDEDLYRTISVGFPSYGMPRFAHLSVKERWALVQYIKSLSKSFAEEKPEKPIAVKTIKAATSALIARGREVYKTAECFKCHGDNGRGDGPSASTLKDALGRPALPLDFHRGPRYFKRGARALDIINTFRTGIDGSPMPSFKKNINHEDAVALAHFVASLAKGSSK